MISERTAQVTFTLPKDVLKKLDAKRQDVPRSRYLLRLLEKDLQIDNKMTDLNESPYYRCHSCNKDIPNSDPIFFIKDMCFCQRCGKLEKG